MVKRDHFLGEGFGSEDSQWKTRNSVAAFE